MFHLINSLVVGYLAATGVMANSSIVTRGLFRAVRRATEGNLTEAGIEALAAITAPTVLAFTTTSTMIVDIVDQACELVGPALEDTRPASLRRLVG